MYERRTTFLFEDFAPHCTKPLLADAILFRARHCQVNGELKSLSDEGRTRAWACTLFALFVWLPCAGQKRKVCANAWLIGGLNCRFSVCLSAVANGRILFAKARILLTNCNFPFVHWEFSKVGRKNTVRKRKKSKCICKKYVCR